jgi:hypothetical protein
LTLLLLPLTSSFSQNLKGFFCIGISLKAHKPKAFGLVESISRNLNTFDFLDTELTEQLVLELSVSKLLVNPSQQNRSLFVGVFKFRAQQFSLKG